VEFLEHTSIDCTKNKRSAETLFIIIVIIKRITVNRAKRAYNYKNVYYNKSNNHARSISEDDDQSHQKHAWIQRDIFGRTLDRGCDAA
jgi:hypothetical protein